MTAPDLPRRPVIDPTDPATLGVHIQYMAVEVHTISETMKDVGRSLADLRTTMPTTYASTGIVNQLSSRVDQLESDRDIARGAAPSIEELSKTVNRLDLTIERMRGGFTWLYAAYGATVAAAGLVIAVIKLSQA